MRTNYCFTWNPQKRLRSVHAGFTYALKDNNPTAVSVNWLPGSDQWPGLTAHSHSGSRQLKRVQDAPPRFAPVKKGKQKAFCTSRNSRSLIRETATGSFFIFVRVNPLTVSASTPVKRQVRLEASRQCKSAVLATPAEVNELLYSGVCAADPGRPTPTRRGCHSAEAEAKDRWRDSPKFSD